MKHYFSLLSCIFFGCLLLSLATVGGIPDIEDKEELKERLVDSANDTFGIVGPETICLFFGNKNEEFFGGGLPDIDVYTWKITSPDNQITKLVGGASFQKINHTFSAPGPHLIELSIRRGAIPVFNDSKTVLVKKAPDIQLAQNYILCQNDSLVVNALDPNTPGINEFTFEWSDQNGTSIGNKNELTITEKGEYHVRYFIINSNGLEDCSFEIKTDILAPFNIALSKSQAEGCPGSIVEFKTGVSVFGIWSYEKQGQPGRFDIRGGESIDLSPDNDLSGFGDYTIYFTVPNPNNPSCVIEGSIPFKFILAPELEIISSTAASSCFALDGSLEILSHSNFDEVFYIQNDTLISSSVSLVPGQKHVFPNLAAGVYTIRGISGDCFYSQAAVVNLETPPSELIFDVVDIVSETCTENGKLPGGFTIKFSQRVEARYVLVNEKGGIASSGNIENESEYFVEIGGGLFYLEVYSRDGCSLPRGEEFEVPGLPQVSFEVPLDFIICESYELIPQSTEDVFFELLYEGESTPVVKNKNESFLLTKPGTYEIIAKHISDANFCPNKKEFTVGLIEPVDYDVVFFDQDCFGVQTYKVDLKGTVQEDVIISWIHPDGNIVGTAIEFFPDEQGSYELDVQPANSFACPIPPKAFEVKEPVLSIQLELTATPLCLFGPKSMIELEADFIEEVDIVEWIFYNNDNTQIPLGKNINAVFFLADKEGQYEAVAYNRFECELGRNFIQIEFSPNISEFDVPIEPLIVCESYSWMPEVNEPLNFILSYPNGEKISKNSSQTFTLDQQGTYTIRGENVDPDNPVCANEKSFKVELVSPIPFEVVLINQSCDGEFFYEADISGVDPDLAMFIWTNESGQVVGDQQFYTTDIPGNYRLEVQPEGSLPCDIVPKNFLIEAPILGLDLRLEVGALCPEAASALITLDAEVLENDLIEWWFTDIDGNRSQLSAFSNRKEIDAENEGTYEVFVFNENKCPLGQDIALLMRSMDDVRPVVKESYLICGQYNVGENINPGLFSTYNWYLGEDMVSSNPTFKPQKPGDYILTVNSAESCEYSTTFTVEEDCELRISLPTGIRPKDPDRRFLVYTNHLVDELEVWVFNKWGANIFHCANNNLISEASTCMWDGTVNGENVPIGSYAVKIYYKNIEQNITKTFFESVLVID